MDDNKLPVWFQLPYQLQEVKEAISKLQDIPTVTEADFTDVPATFADLAEARTAMDTLKTEVEDKLNEIITAITQ